MSADLLLYVPSLLLLRRTSLTWSNRTQIRHLLSEPGWSRVIATSLRPVQFEYDDPEDRLRFVSIDQTAKSPEAVAEKLRAVGGEAVSLVLFYTYIAKCVLGFRF